MECVGNIQTNKYIDLLIYELLVKVLGGGSIIWIMFIHTYNDIISLENLLKAWKRFLGGKRSKVDVLEFEQNLMSNLIDLHNDLKNQTYIHGPYTQFIVTDPKKRLISKALVRDRVVHHLLYQELHSYFDDRFIHDSYSCRINKGTHKARQRFARYARKVSNNHTRTCWVLQCDISRFFDSIDHKVLIGILARQIQDRDLLNLLVGIIKSFETRPGRGLPLGNLTSQLLVNIYMNEFDQFMKHNLKTRYYIRYADDFVVLHQDKKFLEDTLKEMEIFLLEKLQLKLHPRKVSIGTYASGIDFLGWIHFLQHSVLRTKTKQRMFKKLAESADEARINSYLGMLKWGNTDKLRDMIRKV